MLIVMVWNFGGFWKAGVFGKKNVGHAAIRIITNDPEQPFYISWWPGNVVAPDSKGIGPFKAKMPDPHSFFRDLYSEGDKMRNSKEFRKFVKKLEKEQKKPKMFAKVQTKKMIETGEKFDLNAWNEKLAKHKEVTDEVIKSFKTTDQMSTYARFYEFIEQMAASGQYPRTLTEFYASLERPDNEDTMSTLRPPDHTFHIPGMSNGLPCGLDDASIPEWWVDYFMGDHAGKRRYKLATENCSTIVGFALIAGGALKHAQPHGKTMGSWTPETIRKFARDILISVAHRSKHYQQFVNENATSLEFDEIWSEKTFRKESSAGKMSHRYDALKKIDAMLNYYPRIPVQETTRSIGERMGTLAKIVAQIQEIHNDRPKSKRKQALNTLGCQCVAEIQRRLLPKYIPLADHSFNVYYNMLADKNQEKRTFRHPTQN